MDQFSMARDRYSTTSISSDRATVGLMLYGLKRTTSSPIRSLNCPNFRCNGSVSLHPNTSAGVSAMENCERQFSVGKTHSLTVRNSIRRRQVASGSKPTCSRRTAAYRRTSPKADNEANSLTHEGHLGLIQNFTRDRSTAARSIG
ncbi:hypothetical protein [Paraburkholderia azotifigens]|uniref:hypothetical protein n=1 Tax=Paraburkholderia azotifigens TaxID=2057004 RepID=UPI0038BDFA0E